MPARVLDEMEEDADEGVGHDTDALSAEKLDPPSYAIAN